MLMEYNGERFRVSERTWEFFKNDHPGKAQKVKYIPEAETYYNYDKLDQLIAPPEDLIRETIKRSYVNIVDLGTQAALDCDGSKMDYYKGAEEAIVQLGVKLIGFNPRLKKYAEELNETYNQLEKEGKIGK